MLDQYTCLANLTMLDNLQEKLLNAVKVAKASDVQLLTLRQQLSDQLAYADRYIHLFICLCLLGTTIFSIKTQSIPVLQRSQLVECAG